METLPFEFEPDFYRLLHPDFTQLDDEDLAEHYNLIGKREGYPCNMLAQREDFVNLVPAAAAALEIGPFASPLLSGPSVRYCDVLDTAGLKARAPEHGMDPSRVPNIDYVMQGGSLDGIAETFDAILSSHAIEHQPDLVAHLHQIERRLAKDGRYFVLVPDKRYCFDRNIAPSTIAEVLQAHAELRSVHTLKSVIEHRAMQVHNDPRRHWREKLPEVYDASLIDPADVHRAIAEHQKAAGAYIDVHAWYFTPNSFRHIIRLLGALELTHLKVERLYTTRAGSVEFWAVLAADPQPAGPWDAATGSGETDALPTDPQPVQMARPSRGLLARTLSMVMGKN